MMNSSGRIFVSMPEVLQPFLSLQYGAPVVYIPVPGPDLCAQQVLPLKRGSQYAPLQSDALISAAVFFRPFIPVILSFRDDELHSSRAL